ncbi:Hsp20 family protein [Bacillus lacus]|uniref:Hsp20 family protein n=1 Tax=Metabacillus lacus TaxID=1983721 RepID=A0A7X2IZI7_9BACI|nr:Hsp20/alpha crystallin family protein [Metabacillus lacus]MRX72675.1 Hsp20 family protein [Metabacillus lacus]
MQNNRGPMRLMNDFFSQRPKKTLLDTLDDYFRGGEEQHAFAVTTNEGQTHFTVTAELPGVPKRDISLELHGQNLNISAVKNSRKRTQIISLPYYVQTKGMRAVHRDGVLKVHFLKQQSRKIEID